MNGELARQMLSKVSVGRSISGLISKLLAFFHLVSMLQCFLCEEMGLVYAKDFHLLEVSFIPQIRKKSVISKPSSDDNYQKQRLQWNKEERLRPQVPRPKPD